MRCLFTSIMQKSSTLISHNAMSLYNHCIVQKFLNNILSSNWYKQLFSSYCMQNNVSFINFDLHKQSFSSPYAKRCFLLSTSICTNNCFHLRYAKQCFNFNLCKQLFSSTLCKTMFQLQFTQTIVFISVCKTMFSFINFNLCS